MYYVLAYTFSSGSEREWPVVAAPAVQITVANAAVLVTEASMMASFGIVNQMYYLAINGVGCEILFTKSSDEASISFFL